MLTITAIKLLNEYEETGPTAEYLSKYIAICADISQQTGIQGAQTPCPWIEDAQRVSRRIEDAKPDTQSLAYHQGNFNTSIKIARMLTVNHIDIVFRIMVDSSIDAAIILGYFKTE